MSIEEIAQEAAWYADIVTVDEPRTRATMWHATDLCRHCGWCRTIGFSSSTCPGKLKPWQVLLSPQGWGPARNIVAFTGGDLCCVAEFYAEAASYIKRECGERLWVLIETNGYGLTPSNLEVLQAGGVDAFWLDIKAFNEETYRHLCGTTNRHILEAPARIRDLGFTLEVLTLYIPGWVEVDQISSIARLIADVDPWIPFTILAFFPAYRLKHVPPPTVQQLVRAYHAAINSGLKQVKVGNTHVAIRTEADRKVLHELLPIEAIG